MSEKVSNKIDLLNMDAKQRNKLIYTISTIVILFLVTILFSIHKKRINAIKTIDNFSHLDIEIQKLKIARDFVEINDTIGVSGATKMVRSTKGFTIYPTVSEKDTTVFHARRLKKGDRILKDAEIDAPEIFRAVRNKDTIWLKINM